MVVTPAPRFALVGAAGYVAPRHLRAISQIGGTLVAACDPHDSVGILDRYSFGCRFFVDFDRFSEHLRGLIEQGTKVDYVAVCSPNDLHEEHVLTALSLGADVICEKPLVLDPKALLPISKLCQTSGRRVHPILQLRWHPAILRLKKRVLSQPSRRFQVELTYVTPRGSWYDSSWKGDEQRSGGVVTNIGVHLFDLLLWLFGPVEDHDVHQRGPRTCSGSLRLKRADVRWFLSIDPQFHAKGSSHASRTLLIDGTLVDCSQGFSDLHTEVYRRILAGTSETLEDARAALELTSSIRFASVSGKTVQPSSLRDGRETTI